MLVNSGSGDGLFDTKPLPMLIDCQLDKLPFIQHIEARTKWTPFRTFKRIFLNENVRISIKISLKFVPMGPINNILALVQIMA